VKSEVTSHLSGIFHVTEAKHLLRIFSNGLRPGGTRWKRSRMDVHFMPFFPLDDRNHVAKKRLTQSLDDPTSRLVVLLMKTECFWTKEIRLSTSNGYLLARDSFPATDIDSVYQLIYKDKRWRAEVWYHPDAEKLQLRGCRQGEVCNGWKIADVLGGTKEQRAQIQTRCDQENDTKFSYLKKAAQILPTEEEKKRFPNLSL
jgi:hypothetical protein